MASELSYELNRMKLMCMCSNATLHASCACYLLTLTYYVFVLVISGSAPSQPCLHHPIAYAIVMVSSHTNTGEYIWHIPPVTLHVPLLSSCTIPCTYKHKHIQIQIHIQTHITLFTTVCTYDHVLSRQ